MAVRRRDFLLASAGFGLASTAAPFGGSRALAETGERLHGHSLLGSLKYGPEFKHFDYVNPAAPKGGRARLSVSALFDTFNPYNAKGTAASGVAGLVFETLMEASYDEGSTHYGLLAEWMEIAPDKLSTAFRLRDGARWHDGQPVTVADVIESFRLFTTKGHPLYRFYYGDVTEVVDEGDRVVRFKFKSAENKELPHILGQVVVLPAHWWADRPFDKTILEAPLGSGPYRIGAFEEGVFVEYDRVPDYWGADLPVRVGAENFDTVRFDSFLDRDTAFEAFKKGDIDYWEENSASRWAQRFDFPAIQSGKVVKREIELAGPKPMQGFVFNTRRAKFADRRVRAALSMAYDFTWSNSAVFFDQYAQPTSFFQGSADLMATGLPDGAELALLEPYRGQLPAELFETPYENPKTDGSGADRRVLRRAAKALAEAGWTVKDGVLSDAAGAPMEIEFLARNGGSAEKLAGPLLRNFERLGVKTSFREVDTAQYVSRVRAYDFDMVTGGVSNSESPGNEQREYWGTAAADAPGGRNWAGLKNPVVDALIETIITAPDRAALTAASRALDRVLLWEHPMIMQLYAPLERIAYWDRFSAPDPTPPRSVGFPTVWWWDAAKAAKL